MFYINSFLRGGLFLLYKHFDVIFYYLLYLKMEFIDTQVPNKFEEFYYSSWNGKWFFLLASFS